MRRDEDRMLKLSPNISSVIRNNIRSEGFDSFFIAKVFENFPDFWGGFCVMAIRYLDCLCHEYRGGLVGADRLGIAQNCEQHKQE